ncbi:hypothetical protein F5884DRAFT_248860 [Xylogone sp. PMI_703]|nr:hypothetical protein F5884DRAFT_248860 [Xylogone sp. PMI_703]
MEVVEAPPAPAPKPAPVLSKKCSHCDRRFSKVEHLRRHQRSHTGEKPFKCDFCGRRYARSDVLHRHVQSYHPSDPSSDKARTGSRKLSTLTSNNNNSGNGNSNSNGEPSGTITAISHHEEVPVMDTQHPGIPGPPPQMLFGQPNLGNGQIPSPQLSRNDLRSPTLALDSLATASVMQAQNDMNPPPSNIDPALTPMHDGYSTMRSYGRASSVSQSISTPAGPPPGQTPQSVDGTVSARMNGSMLQPEQARPSMDMGAPTPRMAQSYDALSSWQPPYGHDFMSTPSNIDMWNDSMMMDFMDLVEPPYFMAPLRPRRHRLSQSELKERVPNERFMRVARLWPTRRTPHYSLMSHLWASIVAHPEDNLFADTTIASSSPHPPVVDFNGSRWGLDEERRQEFIHEYGSTTFPVNNKPSPAASNHDTGDSMPGRRPSVNRSDSFSHSQSGASNMSKFPSAEILDMSLDQYFRQFHPLLPFIHQPTFNAKTAPTSLVFPMCLVGLTLLDSIGTKKFVCAHLPAAIEKCRKEMVGRLTKPEEAVKLLTTLASATLLLNAAATCGDRGQDVQAQMLYLETMSVAQRNGLFAPDESNQLNMSLFQSLDGDAAVWKAWARCESAKRLFVCLIMLDAYLSYTLGTAPLIRTGTISLKLPCAMELFQAFTPKSWLRLVNCGSPMIKPTLNIGASSTPLPKGLIDSALAMHGLLSVIWLRVSEARHRLLLSHSYQDTKRFLVPAEIYATDSQARHIAPLLLDILSTYSQALQSINSNCMALWHSLSMMLTSNISLFELAAGRSGADAAKSALDDIATWSRSPAARRSCLHAAHIFLTISRRRVSDGTMFHSEIALFNAALVLGLYVFMMPQTPTLTQVGDDGDPANEPDPDPEPFEIMDPVDWIAVGMEGLISDNTTPSSTTLDPSISQSQSQSQTPYTNQSTATGQPNTISASQPSLPPPPPQAHSQSQHPSIGKLSSNSTAAKHFIREGGVMSFSGAVCYGGYNAARRIFLEYAALLEEIGKWSGRELSFILRIMSDSLLDLDAGDEAIED